VEDAIGKLVHSLDCRHESPREFAGRDRDLKRLKYEALKNVSTVVPGQAVRKGMLLVD
jgi:hypothetical protein